jgi:hypothetical protein
MSKLYVDEILPKVTGNHVTIANPYCYIYKNGNQDMTEGTRSTITGWTEGYSQGLSLSGNGITVNDDTAGIYFCALSVAFFDSGNAIGDARASILVGGTRKLGSYNMIVSGSTSSNPYDLRHFRIYTSGIVQINSGEEVTFDALVNGSTCRINQGDSESTQDTNFVMFRLGAV